MTPADLLSLPSRAFAVRAARRSLALVAASVAALWPTWPPLAQTWSTTTDYGHGGLVLLLSIAWLAYASRRIPDTSAPGGWKATSLLCVALFGWLLAYKANVDLGKQLLAPLVIWLAVASGAGWRAAVALAAPILYFYFAIPVWELFVPLLQLITVAVSHMVLGLLGIPVKIDGVLVTIPEGSFIVQEGCSGKRYLIVALAVACLIAPLLTMSRRKGIAYVAIAGALALLANWIRVMIVIYAGHVTNMKHYFVAREHASLGWLIFLILLVAVCSIGWAFKGPVRRPAAPAAPSGEEHPGKAAALLATLAVLCVSPIAIGYSSHRAANATAVLPAEKSLAGWTGPMSPSGLWDPRFVGATAESQSAFEYSGGGWVEAFRATYANQTSTTKLVNYFNRVVGDRWLVLDTQHRIRQRPKGQIEVTTVKTRDAHGQLWLIDYSYNVDGIATSREWLTQVLFGLHSWTHAAPSSVIAVAAQCGGTCDTAQATLSRFWSTTYVAVDKSYTADLPASIR